MGSDDHAGSVAGKSVKDGGREDLRPAVHVNYGLLVALGKHIVQRFVSTAIVVSVDNIPKANTITQGPLSERSHLRSGKTGAHALSIVTDKDRTVHPGRYASLDTLHRNLGCATQNN
ncbi:hypothetical protein NBH19_23725 [Rhizobium sp. S95]|uniref:Uncharacterized protein n=1 Tax=Ciceribacter sichuanensis TaxID=2949647 RepID=A0AAJ1BUP2_9HYPH|nr:MULTISPECIES: hypothetical protein [unclassified Ciceribacter]MCM2399098.1 hypothetical protein [Ciceribacter sp. S95]MCO5956696.1 hypothetical protein [Ciceribacter sp. S101]